MIRFSPRRAFGIWTMAAAALAVTVGTASAASNGVNLQPSYYNNGNVNFGWSLMNANSKIRTVRIEIEPGKETQARTWISQARSNGKTVIATYHKSAVLGSDSTSELTAAGNWWRNNYSNLSSAGSIQVNLMNEWGSHNLSSNSFASAYNTAISLVRSRYGSNIVVDISGWGQETVVATNAVRGTNGTRINDTNITLSAHVYPGAWNQAVNRWLNSADLNLMRSSSGRTCILGEFGTGSGGANWSAMVDNCRNNGWSILGWAWNGDGGSLNMVTPSWAQNSGATSFSKSGYFNTIYNKL